LLIITIILYSFMVLSSLYLSVTARVATISAYEVIRGKYKDTDTLPDEDLGKSITPGFRNISLSVSYI